MLKAILVMVVMGANGDFEEQYQFIEGDNANVQAYDKCYVIGDQWIYDDPEKHLAFKCIYLPNEKSF